MTFPGSVLSSWYSLLSTWFQTGGTAGLDAFTAYLNKDGNNPVIRIYVAGTSGQGHQSATANLMRRLFMPEDSTPRGFSYAGCAEVYLDGGEELKKRFMALLPELEGDGPEYTFFEGKVKFATFDTKNPPADNVNIGLTGGADEDIHYAAALNTGFFLRLQPYRWDAPQQVQFVSDKWPYVNLEKQKVLGYDTLVERAYAQPQTEIDWSDYSEDQRAAIIEWACSEAAEGNFDFMPVYSIRYPAKCEMGTPAQDRIVQVCAAVMAAQNSAAAKSKNALIINLDTFEPNDEYNFTRVAAILKGGPTNFESNLGTEPNQDMHFNARHVYLKKINPNGTRFSNFLYKTDASDNLEQIKKEVENAFSGHSDCVFWLQLGRKANNTSLLPPPVFDYAFSNGTLPGIFEGQNTANLMLNTGKPYFHVNRPQTSASQYPTRLLGLDGQAAVPRRFQKAADQINTALESWPADEKQNPAEQTGGFLSSYQKEAEDGPLHSYLESIKDFYSDPLNEKFSLVLTFYNYLINGRVSPPQPSPSESTDTLDSIYTNFSEADTPVSFAAQLDPEGQISKFVVDMQSKFSSQPFTLSDVKVTKITAGDTITNVTVTGTTDLFGGGAQRVQAIFTAPDGPVQLDCRFIGDLSWSPDGVPWIGFADPFIGFTVADGDIPVNGVLGGTLSGPDIIFEVQLPPLDNQICFTGFFDKPPSIASLYAMAGGINLVASLPTPLNIVSALAVQDVRFAYDTQSGTISVFAFDVGWSAGGSQQPMPLFGNVSLNTMQIGITVTQPGRAASLSAKLASQFTIGSGDKAAVISIGAAVPDMTFSGELTSGEIGLNDLLQMFLPGVVLFPPSTPVITQFSFSCAQKTGNYEIACQLGFDWTISLFGTPLLLLENVGLQAQSQNKVVTGKLSASVTLLPEDPDNRLTLLLSAEYISAESGWRFSGKQDPDQEQQLSLNRLVKTYLGEKWALPGCDYGIDGIAFSTTPTIGTYTIAGKTAEPWVVPFIPELSISAHLDLGYGPPATDPKAKPVLSGELGALIDWYSVEIALTWKFGEDGKYTYVIDWGMLHTEIAQNDKEEWVATGSLKDQTLGSMIEKFVSFATGSEFGLSAPWDALDSIPLGIFEVTFNFTTKKMGFNVDIGPIELGFATIEKIGVVYDPSEAKRKVQITLIGKFAWTDDTELPWDATEPDKTPAPPGGGNKYVDLRLLALGQHVGLVGAPDMKTVADAIKALRNLDENDAPITGPNTHLYFDPAVAWLVGMDFGLMKIEGESEDDPSDEKTAGYTVELSTVFDDPLLYGLRVALDGPAAKVLKGLAFEILYRRISDTVGVYQAELALPKAMRTIDIGAYSLTFPTFSLSVYTNGDFQADFGFPWNQDFSRSFTVQAIIPPGIPVLGAAGIYFGKLSSATTNKVPAATNGQFNPVIVFGFGAQVGFGKEVSYGILEAGFSLTVFGIIEGVIAKWCPNVPEISGGNQLQIQNSYYFWLQGSLGIIGRLYGSVDFAVIKAAVDVRIMVMVQITYESYADIPISVIAAVDVSAKLEIDLGIFSITLHFSFALTIKETFVIQNPQRPEDAPWQITSATMQRSNARRLRHMRLYNAAAQIPSVPVWTNLLPAQTPVSLTAWLAPALTVCSEGAANAAAQKTAYVTLIALESVDPSVKAAPGTADTSFELLAKQVLRWMVAAVQPAPLSAAQADALIVSDDLLLAISDYLSDAANPVPLPVSAIEAFMQGQFRLSIGTAGSGKINATPFPMPPQLRLDVPSYNGSAALHYSFADFNSTSSSYINELRAYFDALAVIVQPKQPVTALLKAGDTGISVGSFLFADQFRLIAKQMTEACRVALRDYTYTLVAGQSTQDVLNWVNQTGKLAPLYTGAELFAANPNKPLSTGAALTICGTCISAPAGATFTSLATAFGQNLTATALATQNADADQILTAGATITVPGKADYTIQPRDTLNSIAAGSGLTLANLLSSSNILTGAGILLPLSVLRVPDVRYNTVADDTLTRVAQHFAITIEELATGTNLAIKNLFNAAQGDGTLSLAHLPQLTLGALIEEVQSTGQISQLAGMAGRYSLHGLRLPTDGVTPLPASCDPAAKDCPIYALTGQQFTIPALMETPFAFTLSRPAEPGWVSFAGGDTLAFTMGELQTAQTRSLQAYLASANYTFDPPGATVQAEAVYRMDEARWSIGAPTAWACAGTIALPYGQVSGQTSLRLWPLPEALVDLYDETRTAPPRAVPYLSVYDEASGATQDQDIGTYAWAMQVGVTVKRRTAAATPADACTYELVGVGESEITLLERFLSWSSGSSAAVAGFDLLYPGLAAAGASGLQSTDPTALTWGLVQVNLSTVTNPPSSLAAKLAVTTAPGACFNSAYDFVKLLWECSITRSGGFYLYYCNGTTGEGLPSAIFNDKGEAQLSLVLRVNAAGEPAQQNLLPGFINTLLTGTAFETGNASVVVCAAPLPSTHVATREDTLAGLALQTYTDPLALAQDNSTGVSLATGAQPVIRRGLYVVGPSGTTPGGSGAAIADWFGTTLAALQTANPQITNWSVPLATGTALRLPDIVLTIGTSKGGTTLAALGTYYGCGIDGIAADNLNLAGLFTGATLSVRGGPTTRTCNTPPGSVTVEANRQAADPVPPPADANFARLFLQENYNLLGYSLLQNSWFTQSPSGLPISASDPPQDQARATNRRRLARAAVTDTPLHYSRVVPASRYAAATEGLTANGPDPTQSPYLGLGGIAQLDLFWLDSFGNRIIGSLGRTPAGAPAQPPAMPLLYTDSMIALGQWSGVSASYAVTGTPGNASLQVKLSFDPTVYTVSTPGWQDRARQALNLYDNLYYQLSASFRAILRTSLLRAGEIAFSTQQLADMKNWLFGEGGIYAFLTAQAAGGTATAPANMAIAFPLPTAACNTAELFEITVAVVFHRPQNLVAASFADAAGVTQAVTTIAPDFTADSGAGGDQTLSAFALAFETALSSSEKQMVKLACGIDRRLAQESGKSLWLVRLAPQPGLPPQNDAAGFAIQNAGAPMIYAPRPVYNVQKSPGNVPIYDYVSGKGIDFSKVSRYASFAAVDADVWLGKMLDAVDNVLSPALTSSAALVDLRCKSNTLKQLLAVKEDLAGALSAFLIPVFCDEKPTPTDVDTAQEALRQKLLQTLSGFYSVSAAVQFAATVVADMNEPEFTTQPQLYGTLQPALTEPVSDPGISLTAAKLTLASTAAGAVTPVTFLASSRNGRDASGAMEKAATLNLVYRGLQIEHQIGTLPNIEGYKASTWLTFVRPPDPADSKWPLSAALGSFRIPLILRAYPTPPSMVSQDASQFVTATEVTDTLEEAVLWNYAFVYSQAFHYPHDAVEFVCNFNVATPATVYAMAMGRDLIADLAEFVTVYPQVAVDLTGVLATVSNNTVDPQVLNTARIALQSLVDMTAHVAEALGGASLKAAAERTIGDGQQPYAFSLTEDSVTAKDPDGSTVEALRVILVGKPPQGIGMPGVDIEGYVSQISETDNGYSFVYTEKSSGKYLTAQAGQSIARRSISLPELNILAAQNAQTSAAILRNQNLVEGRITAPDFVYQTSPVSFATPLKPTLTVDTMIDIAAIGSDTPVKRTLNEQLDVLFCSLFAKAPAGPQQIQLTISYSVSPNQILPSIQLPVAFFPPIAFLPNNDKAGTEDPCSQTDLVTRITNVVNTWYATNKPVAGGTLRFDLKVMARQNSAANTPPMPLLELTNLVLHYADWSDPPLG